MAEYIRETMDPESSGVDVGSHEGEFLEYFLSASPLGKHMAFEPLPHYAATLRQRFPSVEIVEVALGASNGTAEFHFAPKAPAWSGLREQEHPNGVQWKTADVQLRRLDDVLPTAYDPDLIKVDVEGAELLVFQGAQETLARARPSIIFEHALLHSAPYDYDSVELYELLVKLDYSVRLLAQSSPLTCEGFVSVCTAAWRSNYGRDANTNFLAVPNERPDNDLH